MNKYVMNKYVMIGMMSSLGQALMSGIVGDAYRLASFYFSEVLRGTLHEACGLQTKNVPKLSER